MKQRVLTAMILAPLVVCAVLFLPLQPFFVLLVAVMSLGFWEWTRLCRIKRRRHRTALLALFVLAALWLHWPAWLWDVAPWLAGASALFWCASLLWLNRPTALASRRYGRWFKLAFGYVVLLGAVSAFMMLRDEPHGARWTLFAMMIVWAADTFAYFSGRAIGGAKMAPNISPNKTWAGFAGGIVGAMLFAWLVLQQVGLSQDALMKISLISGLCALFSVVGDLVESILKRQAGVKDSGTIIPGHGGLLDRLDSLLAAVPVFAVLKMLAGV